MKKPLVVKKINLEVAKVNKKILTREEYINIGPGSERQINGEIYDLLERLKLLSPGPEKLEVLKKIKKLRDERDKPLPPYDWGEYADIDFDSNESKYDSDGMRDDDDYNPKNWPSHDD